MPTTTGAGFFTPGAETSGNLFRWDVGQPPAFRMGAAPSRPRDSMLVLRYCPFALIDTPYSATNESSFYPVDTPFQPIHRITRSQPVIPTQQPPMSRPLSSADETGPVAKKLRSTSRQPEAAVRASKSSKLTDDTLKKARVRPALTFANFFSSSGRTQPTTSSRTSAAIGKSNQAAGHGGIPTRRSTRLLSGTSTKQGHSKVNASCLI